MYTTVSDYLYCTMCVVCASECVCVCVCVCVCACVCVCECDFSVIGCVERPGSDV